MSIPDELFSGYLIQYCISRIHFFLIYSFVFLSGLEILADHLNASISVALILLLSSSYKIQGALNGIWWSKDITKNQKKMIYNSTFKSFLIYGNVNITSTIDN